MGHGGNGGAAPFFSGIPRLYPLGFRTTRSPPTTRNARLKTNDQRRRLALPLQHPSTRSKSSRVAYSSVIFPFPCDRESAPSPPESAPDRAAPRHIRIDQRAPPPPPFVSFFRAPNMLGSNSTNFSSLSTDRRQPPPDARLSATHPDLPGSARAHDCTPARHRSGTPALRAAACQPHVIRAISRAMPTRCPICSCVGPKPAQHDVGAPDQCSSIAALQVLDDRHLGGLLLRHDAHDGRDRRFAAMVGPASDARCDQKIAPSFPGRTVTGCSTPCARIESASSSSDSTSNRVQLRV